MLEQLRDQIRECLERAADAEYLTMEKRWLTLPSSYGFTESLGDFTTANSEWRRKFDERLRANTSTPEIRAHQFPRPASTAETSDDWAQLHEISTLSIPEGNRDSLYDRILDAAVVLMSSDMASTQLLDPKRNQLRLLAWKGFHPQSASFWEWVFIDSACTCGLALSAGARVVVPDIETCDFMASPLILMSIIDQTFGLCKARRSSRGQSFAFRYDRWSQTSH